MATTTDKQRVQELKNGKKTTVSNSQPRNQGVKEGANRIVDLVNQISDQASDQLSDVIMSSTINKTMDKLGVGNGPLTDAAINNFTSAFTQILVTELPELTGASDDPKYYLPSASLSVEVLGDN